MDQLFRWSGTGGYWVACEKPTMWRMFLYSFILKRVSFSIFSSLAYDCSTHWQSFVKTARLHACIESWHNVHTCSVLFVSVATIHRAAVRWTCFRMFFFHLFSFPTCIGRINQHKRCIQVSRKKWSSCATCCMKHYNTAVGSQERW